MSDAQRLNNDSDLAQQNLPSEFGSLLRTFRQREGLTQQALALAAFGNNRKSTIGELEKESSRVPYPHSLKKLCDALNLSAPERSLLAAAADRRRTGLSRPKANGGTPVPQSSGSVPQPGSEIPRSGDPEDSESEGRPGVHGSTAEQKSDQISIGYVQARRADGRSAAEQPVEQLELLPEAGLPSYSTPFVGRTDYLFEGLRLLMDRTGPKLITIVGSGGSGKTRIAVELAHQARTHFRDGVAFVGLDPVENSDDVLTELTRLLGVSDGVQADIVVRISNSLGGRDILIILDNFEQVRDAAVQIARLLNTTHAVRFLVTSRVPLNITGEYQFRIDPLALPETSEPADFEEICRSEAVQFFVQRANARSPIRLDENNAAGIASLCRRLDGLPLALELAAGRTTLMSPQAILDRLERNSEVLGRGPQDLPTRQQTLRATLDWSYHLLEVEEANFFKKLSVFADSWTIEGAEAVVDVADAVEAMSALLDKNMVVQHRSGGFRMLRTVREYASELLEETGESYDVRLRYIDWCIANVRIAAENARRMGTAIPNSSMEDFHAGNANFVGAMYAALELGDHERLAALVGCMADFWVREGRHYQLERWVNAALAGSVSAEHQASLNRAATAVALYVHADPLAALEKSRAAAIAFDALGQVVRAIGMRYTGGHALRYLGRFDEAAAEFERVVEQTKVVGEVPFQILEYSGSLAVAYDDLGLGAAAERIFKEYFREAEAQSNEVAVADAMLGLSQVYCAESRLSEARGLAAQSVELAQAAEFGAEEIKIDVLNGAGWVYLASDEPVRAKALLQEALSLAAASGYRLIVPGLVCALGATAAALGEYQTAVLLLESGQAELRATNIAIVGRAARRIHAIATHRVQEYLFANEMPQLFSNQERSRDPVKIALNW